MTTYFKATQPDGTDFFTGSIHYADALANGTPVSHPDPHAGSDASGYFSVATVSTDCTGFTWPARLFEVEPVGGIWTPDENGLPNKRAATALTVTRELPAHELFGPQGEAVVSIIDQYDRFTSATKDALYRARGNAWFDAYNNIWAVAGGGRADRAGLRAARRALSDRLGDWCGGAAAYGAALAVLTRHLIGTEVTQADYDSVTEPWRRVVGPAHPDDRVPAKVTRS